MYTIEERRTDKIHILGSARILDTNAMFDAKFKYWQNFMNSAYYLVIIRHLSDRFHKHKQAKDIIMDSL